MHILSADQFDNKQISQIIRRADYFKKIDKTLSGRKKLVNLHKGRHMASLFFQPSTRTRTSFETAAIKMGMGVVSTENAREHSSSAKGETIEDTFRVLNGYGFDVIVMRHHEAGAAQAAAVVSKTPLINAGDGAGEHPTQALLDAYTIKSHHGRLDNLRVVMGGDLKQGRTVRSLSKLLSKYKDNHLVFVSIPGFQMGDDIKAALKKSKTSFEETADLSKAFKNADVVYWTRLQTEHLKGVKKSIKGLAINTSALKHMPKKAIIMHPLPRVDEIHPSVDADPRAKYFDQAANGLFVRMALIDQILSSKNG